MTGCSEIFHGIPVYVRESGPALASEQDAVDLM